MKFIKQIRSELPTTIFKNGKVMAEFRPDDYEQNNKIRRRFVFETDDKAVCEELMAMGYEAEEEQKPRTRKVK